MFESSVNPEGIQTDSRNILVDRYNKDRDYADGVDDAEEDEEEYGEDW